MTISNKEKSLDRIYRAIGNQNLGLSSVQSEIKNFPADGNILQLQYLNGLAQGLRRAQNMLSNVEAQVLKEKDFLKKCETKK